MLNLADNYENCECSRNLFRRCHDEIPLKVIHRDLVRRIIYTVSRINEPCIPDERGKKKKRKKKKKKG